MNKKNIIKKIAAEVRKKFNGEGTGHDWWHVWRVWQMARRIGREEGADLFIVELAALVHEMGDEKISGGQERHERAGRILAAHGVALDTRRRIMNIVQHMSFRDNLARRLPLSLEGKIVQDADRLDAVGAIGIARAFAFGGRLGRPLYDPTVKPKLHTKKNIYTKREGTTINHFYEKVLLLKDRMNTKTAKRIADNRHIFTEEFLTQFLEEWSP